ncbi:hypothetical protein RCL1_003637 [Eukaryota sp. TZLM3-RCL]
MRQPEIQEAFKNDLRNDADLALANWFYGQGISFNNADSELFQSAIAAVIKAGPSYKPPSAYQLSTTLLDKAVDKIDSQLVPFKEELGLVPGTLVSDGWKNTNKVPLLNVLIATEHGSCFVDNVDSSGKSKTADYVAEVIIDHINKVGEENVILVITDNASECKAAGTIVEEVVPQVFWSPCTSHTVDLFLKDIPKHFPTFVSVFESVKAINQFMTARSSVHHVFRGHADLEIKTPGKTRFFSNFITLERTLKLRAAFERTLIDESFTEYVSLQDRDYRVEASNLRTVVLSNEFWEHVEQLILLMKPAVDFINEVNGNSPSTGEVWKRCQMVRDAFNNIPVSNLITQRIKTGLKKLWQKRATQMLNDFRITAYILNPRYLDERLDDDSMMESFHNVLARMVGDEEYEAACNEFVRFRRQFQLSPKAVELKETMSGSNWWQMFGHHFPVLKKVAVKLLSQVSTSSAAERNWSVQKFIHCPRRNRLTVDRARKLIYIYENLRLLQKISA